MPDATPDLTSNTPPKKRRFRLRYSLRSLLLFMLLLSSALALREGWSPWQVERVLRGHEARWRVELFFKWIKQHLRIKAFYGTSPNAVKTQIWIAIATYVTVAILKKRLKLEPSMYTILQVLSVNLFEKTPIVELFTGFTTATEQDQSYNQLTLFDLYPDSSDLG